MTDHLDLDGQDDAVLRAWITACHDWTAQIAELTDKRNRAYQLIKDRLGDSTEARISGRPVVSWAWSKPAEYIDAKALKAEMPEVAAKFTKLKAAARPFKLLDAPE